MKKVMKICEEIKNAKTNQAIQILRENKGNEKLRQVLNFAYNPFITSGISDGKYYKKVYKVPTKTFKNFLEVLEYIKENNTGTDEVICNVQNYINKSNLNKEQQRFVHDVITKNLIIGIGVETINKAFQEKFIPKFEVQLAEKYYDLIDEVKEKNKPFTLTLKLDGHRCIIIKNGDVVKLYSRNGKPIEGCLEIEKCIKKSKYKKFVLDGELLAKVDSNMTSQERFRKTLKELGSNKAIKDVEFFAFDFLTLKQFKSKKCIMKYSQRRGILFDIVKDLVYKNKPCPIIFLQKMYEGNDYEVIEPMLAEVKKKNLEGLMMNINDAVYDFKRTKSLLKIKVMNDVDLRILKVKEGSGRLEGTLGRIICDYKGYKLGVGSGFSDEDRKEIWEHPKRYIGKLAKIQYFEETQNESGELSLRFPVYLGLTTDREYGTFEEV